MKSVKSASRMLAEELCEKYPDHSNLGLARRLRKENPECFASIDNARTMVRTIRGVRGNRVRKYATQPRKKGKAGTKPQMPPSHADEWTPFECPGQSIGIISDLHIPYHKVEPIEAAVTSLKKRKIDTLLINGDFADFYQVSHWQRNPKRRSFREELNACKEALDWLRSKFPDAEIIYKLGNHDERWEKFIWNRAPEIYDVEQCQIESLLDFAKHGIICVKDQRPIMVGKLPVLHGHELKNGISAPVNPARGAYLRTAHSVLIGHSHRTSSHVEPNMWGKETVVWSVGCLCAMNPEYNRFAKSNWGYAHAEVGKDGTYSVLNYRIGQDYTVRTA